MINQNRIFVFTTYKWFILTIFTWVQRWQHHSKVYFLVVSVFLLRVLPFPRLLFFSVLDSSPYIRPLIVSLFSPLSFPVSLVSIVLSLHPFGRLCLHPGPDPNGNYRRGKQPVGSLRRALTGGLTRTKDSKLVVSCRFFEMILKMVFTTKFYYKSLEKKKVKNTSNKLKTYDRNCRLLLQAVAYLTRHFHSTQVFLSGRHYVS